MIELDKIMRPQGDNVFTDILDTLRVGSLNGEDIKILSARKVEKLDLNYPHNAIHIWAENDPVDDHNKQMLDLFNKPLVTLIADDQYPAKHLSMISTKHLKEGVVQMGALTTE